MIHQCTFWVHRGSELCLGGGEAQELPTDINAASSISVFLKSTYMVLQGLTEDIFCPVSFHCMEVLHWHAALQHRAGFPSPPVVAAEGVRSTPKSFSQGAASRAGTEASCRRMFDTSVTTGSTLQRRNPHLPAQ